MLPHIVSAVHTLSEVLVAAVDWYSSDPHWVKLEHCLSDTKVGAFEEYWICSLHNVMLRQTLSEMAVAGIASYSEEEHVEIAAH